MTYTTLQSLYKNSIFTSISHFLDLCQKHLTPYLTKSTVLTTIAAAKTVLFHIWINYFIAITVPSDIKLYAYYFVNTISASPFSTVPDADFFISA